jgi:hypothetical protein
MPIWDSSYKGFQINSKRKGYREDLEPFKVDDKGLLGILYKGKFCKLKVKDSYLTLE